MSKSVITSRGINLLHSAPASGSQTYWIGYYGLAFVPSEMRGDNGPDRIRQGMTTLTIAGDRIYNLWQGAMTPGGFASQSGASDLYGTSLYTGNVMSRYRYVMDADGNNNLVMWKGAYGRAGNDMVGAAVYRGVGASDESGLPLPAPLFYMGEPTEYSRPRDVDGLKDVILGGSSNEYDYPTKTLDNKPIPFVTTDTRGYSASMPSMETGAPDASGSFTATGSFPVSGTRYEWSSSIRTYTQNGDSEGNSPISDEFNRYCAEYWKLQSISNYNRFHAPASAEGYQLDYDPACRNMSKVTKYFPISHYKVLNENDNGTDSTRVMASSLQFTISMDIADLTNATAARTVTRSAPVPSGVEDANGDDLYTVGKSSFKFNRIGLYAVPMTVHRYADEYNTPESKADCKDFHVQFQIQGDAEPVLFAVVDLDQTVMMREGEIDRYEFKVNLNVQNDTGDGSIIRDSAIFYNMYEDSSITWYQNQLLATASMSNAVTDLGIEMNYLKSMMGSDRQAGACETVTVDYDWRYASKTHTHDYSRNIVDAPDGSVRSVDSIDVGTRVAAYSYPVYSVPGQIDGVDVIDSQFVLSSDDVGRTYYVATGYRG